MGSFYDSLCRLVWDRSEHATLLGIAAAGPAWAWGHTDHVDIGRLAIRKLSAELPQFVRSPHAAVEIGELGPEPDESKTTGVVTGGQQVGQPANRAYRA